MPKKTKSKPRAGKTPKKTGRPTKMTPDVVAKLTEGFQHDFTVEEACRFAGISKDAYYDERKRNPAFADEMDRAQDFPLIVAKNRMFAYINSQRDGYGALALKFLERRQRERYTPKLDLEHSGSIAVPYSDLEGKPKPKDIEAAKKAAESEEDWEG